MADKKHILIVEDHPELAKQVQRLLRENGYDTEHAPTIAAARKAVATRHIDLIVLDVNLPDGLGFQLCREIRENDTALPILFLTDRADEDSVVKGLSFATTDYLRKPFASGELTLRLRRLLKETSGNTAIGNLVVNHDERKAKWKGKSISLSPREFDFLSLLMGNAGKLITRERLLEHFGDGDVLEKSVNSYLSRLKTKLAAAGVTGIKISAIYGEGYRLESE